MSGYMLLSVHLTEKRMLYIHPLLDGHTHTHTHNHAHAQFLQKHRVSLYYDKGKHKDEF